MVNKGKVMEKWQPTGPKTVTFRSLLDCLAVEPWPLPASILFLYYMYVVLQLVFDSHNHNVQSHPHTSASAATVPQQIQHNTLSCVNTLVMICQCHLLVDGWFIRGVAHAYKSGFITNTVHNHTYIHEDTEI